MVDSCVICCLNYNLNSRRPWDLGCGHCVCEQCYKTSKLTVCVECRQPANNPHLQYTLLRLLQPGSPTSFPIGVLATDAQEEAPGTPRPSAPVMEVEPCEPDSDSDTSRRTGSNRNSSAGSQGGDGGSTLQQSQSQPQHRLGQQSNHTATHSSTHRSASPSAPPIAPSSSTVCHPLTVLGGQPAASPPIGRGQSPLGTFRNIPVHALEFSSSWAAPDGTVTLGVGYNISSADSIVSHQAFLTSFPVEDFDLLDCSPESSTSSQVDIEDIEQLQTEAAEQEHPAVNTALSVVQATIRCCTTFMQPLLVPHVLFAQGPDQGWPAPGPSLILAATSGSWRTWSAYSNAMQHTFAHCSHLQLAMTSALGCLLKAIGLPNSGQLAAYMMGTWGLGVLLYHWGLGLQLLPVVAAALGLASFASMSSSSNDCCLWPAKLAGAVMTGYCCIVSLVALMRQVTGLGALLHSRLLAATPQALLLAVLLMWGQVVVEVISMGWANYSELKFASLVARCWCISAVSVLFGSGASACSMALAAIPWVQKCHLLLEAPVLVHQLGLLWRDNSSNCSTSSQQTGAGRLGGTTSSSACCSSSRVPTSAVHTPVDGIRRQHAGREDLSSTAVATSGGAWLLSLHVLLQLSLVMFVPPAPLAANQFLPAFVSSVCVWVTRVLLCGCVMQLALSVVSGDTATNFAHPNISHIGSHTQHAGSSTFDGMSSSMTWAGRAQSRSGVCSPRAGDCRGSSSCSVSAVNCMALTARCRSPTIPHGWQLVADSDHRGTHAGYRNSMSAALPAGIGSQAAAIFTGATAIVQQHLLYLTLLCIAAAGDTFIMAVPSAASVADVRCAWHNCVQNMLIVVFAWECAVAVWNEFRLLRYQHSVVAAGLPRQEAGYSHYSTGPCSL